MNEQSNAMQGLRGPIARTALAVFTFAALTAWPLLADLKPADQEQVQVAHAAEQGDSSIQKDASCRT